MSDQQTTDPVARIAYVVLGDCLRHTQDVIARLQDQATGTPLFGALEALRRDVSAVQNGVGYKAVAAESTRGRI